MLATLSLALALVSGARAGAQIPAATSAELQAPLMELQATLIELQALAARAQVIFTGQVTAVERNDAAGFVDVRFRIDRSLRGAPAKGSYVLREWAGLWMGHPDRYQVGERRLMLLTARSASGFSAPVGDREGAIPLVATGTADAASPTGVGLDVGQDAGLDADLGWVEAHAQRGTVASGGAGWKGPIAPLAGSRQTAQAVSLTAVLAQLGGAAPTTVLRGPLHAR
jgi:hypothetical protein